MINITKNRDLYILKPTVPAGTDLISYQVSVNSVVVYAGQTRWFGGTYTIDLKDFIDAAITAAEAAGNQALSVAVSVVFTYTSDPGGSDEESTTQTMTYTWTPSVLGTDLAEPTQSSTCPFLYIELSNSGFLHYGSNSGKVKIPLMCRSGKMVGMASNRLLKTNYMDKYGDTHTGSMDNRYDIECYVDPDWLNVYTNQYNYECVMLALQNALSSRMKSDYAVTIPGFSGSSVTDMEGRVKDLEKVDVRSSYDVNNRIPTLKITYEIYR